MELKCIKENKVTLLGILIITTLSALSILFAYISSEMPEKSIPSYASYLENKFADYLTKSRLSNSDIEDRIILVEIDDLSISKLGSWPINRKYYAQLLDTLSSYQTKIVAFDIYFSEEVASCNEVCSCLGGSKMIQGPSSNTTTSVFGRS